MLDQETIILTRNGLWLSAGEEITHEATRRAFAKNLKKDAQGYFIQIQHETKYIKVEDTAYFVTRLTGDPWKGFELTLNDEAQEKLDPSTLSYRPGRLTCVITRNGVREEAKFLLAAYFDILRELEEDEKSYFVIINKIRVELAKK